MLMSTLTASQNNNIFIFGQQTKTLVKIKYCIYKSKFRELNLTYDGHVMFSYGENCNFEYVKVNLR